MYVYTVYTCTSRSLSIRLIILIVHDCAGFAFGAAVQFLCYVCKTCVPEASSSYNPTWIFSLPLQCLGQSLFWKPLASLFCKQNREGRNPTCSMNMNRANLQLVTAQGHAVVQLPENASTCEPHAANLCKSMQILFHTKTATAVFWFVRRTTWTSQQVCRASIPKSCASKNFQTVSPW